MSSTSSRSTITNKITFPSVVVGKSLLAVNPSLVVYDPCNSGLECMINVIKMSELANGFVAVIVEAPDNIWKCPSTELDVNGDPKYRDAEINELYLVSKDATVFKFQSLRYSHLANDVNDMLAIQRSTLVASDQIVVLNKFGINAISDNFDISGMVPFIYFSPTGPTQTSNTSTITTIPSSVKEKTLIKISSVLRIALAHDKALIESRLGTSGDINSLEFVRTVHSFARLHDCTDLIETLAASYCVSAMTQLIFEIDEHAKFVTNYKVSDGDKQFVAFNLVHMTKDFKIDSGPVLAVAVKNMFRLLSCVHGVEIDGGFWDKISKKFIGTLTAHAEQSIYSLQHQKVQAVTRFVMIKMQTISEYLRSPSTLDLPQTIVINHCIDLLAFNLKEMLIDIRDYWVSKRSLAQDSIEDAKKMRTQKTPIVPKVPHYPIGQRNTSSLGNAKIPSIVGTAITPSNTNQNLCFYDVCEKLDPSCGFKCNNISTSKGCAFIHPILVPKQVDTSTKANISTLVQSKVRDAGKKANLLAALSKF